MKSYLLLGFIIFVAFFLRFWQLGINPPSLTWDEVSWGYNAYSLGIDGRDEFGVNLPYKYLESFGDFKPVVYAYLDVIPVKIFGLNEFSTRFPSALFGSLTVVLTYFLTKRVFRRHNESDYIGLLSALMLAISPWHINLSRAAFEANVATFFLVSGVFFFIAAMQEKKWSLIFSAICFAASIYTFNTSRIVAPLLVVLLAIGFRKELLLRKKQVITAALVGIVLVAPTVGFLLSPEANLRFREVNIFSDISVIQRVNQEIQNDKNASWSKVIHNRRFSYGVEYLRHYFDNLNPQFLFIKGDGNPKFSTQDVGQLYIWDIVFLVLGSFLLFRKKEGNWWIIPAWIMIGIIPAATARETPHALRIETVLPMFQIVVAYGVFYFIEYILSLRSVFRKAILFAAFGLLFLNFLYYFHGYYAHYPYEYSGEWQYGYKESIQYVNSVQNSYKKVYITTELGRPYIYYLFFTKTPPAEFRKSAIIHRDAFGFVSVNSFNKYVFLKDVHLVKDTQGLFIDKAGNLPKDAKQLKEFRLLNGDIALVAYTY